MTSFSSCKNCQAPLRQDFEYCPQCGQETIEDLTMGSLFRNTINNYFSVDARFFKSFFPLLFRPGVLARKFVNGKRKAFLHPAQFYLFMSVVFFFLFSISTRQQLQETDTALRKGFEIKDQVVDSISQQIKKELEQTTRDSLNLEDVQAILDSAKLGNVRIGPKLTDTLVLSKGIDKKGNPLNMNFTFDDKKLDSLIAMDASTEEKLALLSITKDSGMYETLMAKQVLKLYEQKGGGIVKTFLDTIPIAMFFLLPIFAFILKLLHFRRGRFAHHMVFSFYHYSFMFLVMTLIILYGFIFEPVSIGWILFIVFSTLLYLWLGVKRFYGQSYAVSFFKTVVLTFVYSAFVMPMALALIALISLMLY